MSRNWLRACSLQAGGGGGTLELSALRVVFQIEMWTYQSTNHGHFRVYNVAPKTIARFKNKEFTTVKFSAGYQDNVGLVFSGNIVQTISGHETAVDSYLDIFAADGDTAYNTARVTKTLAAGYTPQDKFDVAMDAMGQHGVTLGANALDLSQPKYPRGTPLIGMARDIIRQVVASKNGVWSIQNQKVRAVGKDLQGGGGGSLKLAADTGLIGWPQQTDAGVVTKSLINPTMQPHCVVTLDPSKIIEAQRDNDPISGPGSQRNLELDHMGLAAGTYTVFKLDRSGDTRGGDWYDVATSIGKGGTVPVSQSNLGYYVGQN